ncbi:N-acetyltransferase [Rhodococcus sp. HNM0563]|uniref:GNAT family N-acetyltransferase n=1 Tax=Rhodococcus sp. HNM0563 TaxID=2716339 RepID=UPI00146A6161|nr:GNAT family N-acetyltransferase [Rhodococcus sp. HNM0563]NLU63490.1 N-acetyltransferase [Rhodococcus sp. HNM0563]
MSTDTPDPRLADISVSHNPQRSRYEILDGDTVVGHADYRDGEGTRRVFVHTEVDENYGGLGLAGRLVKFALDDVAAHDGRIVPVCPYVARYVAEHHEYDTIVDRPEGTHETQ